MAPIEPGDSGWPARKERLLERVHARGRALRRRAQIIRGLSVATVLLLLAAIPGALAASGGGGHKSVRTIAGPSTSTSEETTTSVSPTTSTTPVAAPTTVPRSTTTSLVCRNSTNPACGPFRWDPPPAPNRPLTVQVTYSPASPKTGDIVTFHVVIDDPDRLVYPPECGNEVHGFGSGPVVMCSALCAFQPTPTGPWTPPARESGHYETDFQHTYESAGSYIASFRWRSGHVCGLPSNPYGSTGEGSVTVTVNAPPATTKTTGP